MPVNERRRGLALLGLCALAVIALLAAMLVPRLGDGDPPRRPLAAIGATQAQASCDPVGTEPAAGGSQHVAIGTPVDYPQGPPAFGPHWQYWPGHPSGPDLRAFYTPTDRPEVEYLVHSLEHGYTILWYDGGLAADSDDYRDLQEIATVVPSSRHLIVAPWAEADGVAFPDGRPVALTHWTGPDDQQGAWQFCGKPSGEVVDAFLAAYPKADSPEPNAP